MTTRQVALLTAVVLLFSTRALAESQNFQWGGKGYDPALKNRPTSARFAIRPHYDYQTQPPGIDATLVEVLVDAAETANEIGAIRLASQEHEARLQQCWKAMRHITAPWACTFKRTDIQTLRGTGTIQVVDRSNRTLLEEPADFDAMNAFLDSQH